MGPEHTEAVSPPQALSITHGGCPSQRSADRQGDSLPNVIQQHFSVGPLIRGGVK